MWSAAPGCSRATSSSGSTATSAAAASILATTPSPTRSSARRCWVCSRSSPAGDSEDAERVLDGGVAVECRSLGQGRLVEVVAQRRPEIQANDSDDARVGEEWDRYV